MFHDEDVDLPRSVGVFPITTANGALGPRQTSVSLARAQTSGFRKDTTPATAREVDELKLTVRRLEGKIHEMESRVQYVNPAAVQHMWSVILKIQRRVGLLPPPPSPRESIDCLHSQRGAPFPTHLHGGTGASPASRDSANGDDDDHVYRSCSPLTPKHGRIPSADVAIPSSSSPSSLVSAVAARAGSSRDVECDEATNRVHVVADQAQSWAAMMAAFVIRCSTALSTEAYQRQSDVQLAIDSVKELQSHSLSNNSVWADEGHEDLDAQRMRRPARRAFRESSPRDFFTPTAPPPAPRLRATFVEALLLNDTVEAHVKKTVTQLVQPLCESLNQKFMGECERWMQAQINDLCGEVQVAVEKTQRMRDSMLQEGQARSEELRKELEAMVSSSRRSLAEDLRVAQRLREDGVEAVESMNLKMRRLDGFREELLQQVSEIARGSDSEQRSAITSLQNRYDVLQRRLDELHCTVLLKQQTNHKHRGSDDDDGSDDKDLLGGTFEGECCGDAAAASSSEPREAVLAEKSFAYLDGMALAPGATSRLHDSVVLHDIHAAFSALCRGVASQPLRANSKSNGGRCLGITLAELILRPVRLFPLDLVTQCVAPMLLRHSQLTVANECRRLKLPRFVIRGLLVGWKWFVDLSVGMLLRRVVDQTPAAGVTELFGSEVDDEPGVPAYQAQHTARVTKHSALPSSRSEALLIPDHDALYPSDSDQTTTAGSEDIALRSTAAAAAAPMLQHRPRNSTAQPFYTKSVPRQRSTVDRRRLPATIEPDFSHLYVGDRETQLPPNSRESSRSASATSRKLAFR